MAIMVNIQEQLKVWAKETYDFYLSRAKELDLDFYTQSDLTLLSDDKPVELMVIGINPGCGGYFQSDRFTNAEELLRGNFNFKEEGKPHYNISEWRIVTKLRSILDYACKGDLLNDESRFVLTNATFFSTHKETGLKGLKIKEAQKGSIEYTKRLIDIVRPKHIICLGGKNCMNLLLDRTNPLLADIVKLEYGRINDIPTYGIVHTSSFWSTEQMELVGKALGRAFELDSESIAYREFNDNSKDIIELFKKQRNDRDEIKQETNLRWRYIYLCLCNYSKYNLNCEVAEEKKDWTRFYIQNKEGCPTLILAIIIKSNEKSIGVRYVDNNPSEGYDFDAISFKLMDIDKSFRPMINNQGNVTWIGHIDIAKRLKDTDAFVKETKLLLEKTVEALSGI